MILDLIGSYSKLSKYNFQKRNDDDFFDKLSRKYAAIFMVICAIILSVYTLVGSPIQCWCPNDYNDPKCDYAKTFCYITSFYVPVGNTTELPRRNDLQSHRILYYQWVQYIFLLQAFLLYLPCLIWKILNSKSGFDLNSYIKQLMDDTSDLKNSAAVAYVTNHMKTCLDYRSNYLHRGLIKKALNNIFCFGFFNNGMFLTFSFFIVKLLYAGVIFLQLFLINYWLRDDHYPFSMNVFLSHNHWDLKERFPRMTLCRFQVYIFTDQQTQWVQCTLPINIYIEKIFIGVWYLLWILFILTIVGILLNIFRLIRGNSFLASSAPLARDEDIRNLRSYLSIDGVLALYLIRYNTNNFFASSITTNLLKND